jgi:hypothetical protein
VLLARAALGMAGPWSTLGREDPEIVAVLEEALPGWARRTRRCARGCSAGSRSSSTTPASPSGGSR